MTRSRPNRRLVLRLLGGGTLVLGAGLGGWAATRDPAAARAPWAAAAAETDPRRFALAHAVLAPNPHNLQPWLIDLPGSDRIVVHRDPARVLPETDPFDRQIVIGFGCFLETLAIAAAERGLSARITPFPEGADPRRLDARPVAEVRLIPGADPDPLFPAIAQRRSVKEPFEDRLPDPAALAALTAAVPVARTETDPARTAALRELIWRGHEVESHTPRTMRESVDVMRFGRAQIEAQPDGIDIGGPFLEGLWRLGQLSPQALMDPTSSAFATGLDIYRRTFAATPAFVWLPGPATRAGELQAGRDWLRLNLAATQAGLALHPVSQTLQEYPEMADLFARIHALTGLDPAAGPRVHMLGRLGYGPRTPATPRWPLDARLRTA